MQPPCVLHHESPASTILRLGLISQQDLADVLARAGGTAVVSLTPYRELAAPIDPTGSSAFLAIGTRRMRRSSWV